MSHGSSSSSVSVVRGLSAAPGEASSALEQAGRPGLLRDLISLGKPRIMLMAVIVAAGGMALAPGALSPLTALLALLGIGLVVGGAGALNMVLERRSDRLMARTRERPLAAGRLRPLTGAIFGLTLGGGAVALLAALVNPLTALLGAVGLSTYVLLYTPLKRVTPGAVLVGGVAGALPPLMGWTAATGTLDLPGLALFATLFFWQVPHFLAIATYRSEEYARAGIPTRVSTAGERSAWRHLVLHSVALLVTSLVLVPLGTAGWIYGWAALLAGAALLGLGIRGLAVAPAQDGAFFPSARAAERARAYFRATLIYLPVLAAALVLDRWLLGG